LPASLADADWLLVAIPTLGFDVSDGQAGGRPEFSLGLKAARKVGEDLAAGLEAYSDTGPLGHRLPWQQQDNRLSLALDVDRKPWVVKFGAGRSLSNAADRWTFTANFNVPLS